MLGVLPFLRRRFSVGLRMRKADRMKGILTTDYADYVDFQEIAATE
jgi:hypothetical protein